MGAKANDLRRCAPSVFAEHARPGVSSRYTFVSTQQVVALLGAEGLEPIKASEQRVCLEELIGSQTHEIRFARRADLESRPFQGGRESAKMIQQNAHEGTRAYRIDASLYRLVLRKCLNVADTVFAHASIRHMDDSAEAFAKAAQSVAEKTPYVLEAVAKWQAVQLPQATRVEFAHRAAARPWASDQPVMKFLSPEKLLTPIRCGDVATGRRVICFFNALRYHVLRPHGLSSTLGRATSGRGNKSRGWPPDMFLPFEKNFGRAELLPPNQAARLVLPITKFGFHLGVGADCRRSAWEFRPLQKLISG